MSGANLGQKIELVYDHSVDFEKYQTYAWIIPDRIPLIHTAPRPAGSPTDAEIDALVKSSVEKHLKEWGLRKVTSDLADLLVAYVGVGRLGVENSFGESDLGYIPTVANGHWRPWTKGIRDSFMKREGTLTLDMVDRKTEMMVWRASATHVIDKHDLKHLTKKINRSVKKLVKKFPRK